MQKHFNNITNHNENKSNLHVLRVSFESLEARFTKAVSEAGSEHFGIFDDIMTPPHPPSPLTLVATGNFDLQYKYPLQ